MAHFNYGKWLVVFSEDDEEETGKGWYAQDTSKKYRTHRQAEDDLLESEWLTHSGWQHASLIKDIPNKSHARVIQGSGVSPLESRHF